MPVLSASGTAVQKIGGEQFLIPEIESRDTFFRIPRGSDGIHFDYMRRRKLPEITVKPAREHMSVGDLCFMAFTRLELNFAFQVDVTAGKQSELYVLIGRTYRKTELGMLHNDLVRGMILPDQRGNSNFY